MKKRILSLVMALSVTMGIFSGTLYVFGSNDTRKAQTASCSAAENTHTDGAESSDSAAPVDVSVVSGDGREAVNSTLAFLNQKTAEARVGTGADADVLPDEGGGSLPTEFVVESVRQYEDETIVRYIQTCGGVEIWNSDIVVSDAENPALVGNYLNLSDAFGSEFETLKNEAGTLPDWMQDTEEIRFDKNTLRPVIFIDEDQTAYMARFVTVTVTGEDHVELRADLVLSLDGETMYDYVPESEPDMYDSDSFDPATLYGSEIQVEGARIGNKYYAYDQKRNYYVYFRSRKGVKSKRVQITLKKLLGANGMAADPAYMYSLSSDQWNRDQADYIIETMNSFNQAYDWYAEELHYYGTAGHGETMVLTTGSRDDDTRAMCMAGSDTRGLTIYSYGDIYKSPEIYVHEMGHGIQDNIVGHVAKSGGEAGALKEAMSDILAACYLKNDRWLIGGETEKWRNISRSIRMQYGKVKPCPETVDGFMYDHEVTKGWEKGIYIILTAAGEEFSDKTKYFNANIISHTVYVIWRDLLNKDYDLLARIMMESFRYLSRDFDFSEFEYAFLHSLEKLHPDENIVEEARLKFSKAGIYVTANDWINKVSRAESQSAAAMDKISTYYYSVLLPENWTGKYTSDITEEENCQSLNLYHSASQEAGAGGLIASLKLMKEGADYSVYPGCEVIGAIVSPDGTGRRILVLYHPTDAQFTGETVSEYQELEQGLQYVVGSIRMLNGYMFETIILSPADMGKYSLPVPLSDLYGVSWAELNAMDLGQYQVLPAGESDAFTVVRLLGLVGTENGAYYRFYASEYTPNMTENDLLVELAMLEDYQQGSHHMKITDNISTGMTYAEVCRAADPCFISSISGLFSVSVTDPRTMRVITLNFSSQAPEENYPDNDAILISASIG